jgi:multidrug efflux pump subunit AcrB
MHCSENRHPGRIHRSRRAVSASRLRTANSESDVRDTVVAVHNGQITRVSDVAEVRWDNAPLSYVGRYNGQRAVFVTRSSKTTRTFSTNERIAAAVDAFRSNSLPARIQLEWGSSQADNCASTEQLRDFGTPSRW